MAPCTSSSSAISPALKEVKMKFWLVFALFGLLAITVGVHAEEGTAEPEPSPEGTAEPSPHESAPSQEASAEPTPEPVATNEDDVEDVGEEVENEIDEVEDKEGEEIVDEYIEEEETVELVEGEPAPSTEARDSTTPGSASQAGLYLPSLLFSALVLIKFAH
ncbi:YTH domain-containing protein 1 isoform X2 [Cherax quadricarinatus]|nr:retinitis pigmentosa 1-like 1 protein isoform X2 [Cherax quadricarinatus]